jgi:Fic family protein
MDGNGRMGRFLMNVMLASGGYPWTIIPVEKCSTYMAALEAASVENKSVPFTNLLAKLLKASLEGKPGPKAP